MSVAAIRLVSKTSIWIGGCLFIGLAAPLGDSLLDRGLEAFRKRNFATAEQLFKQALREQPVSARIYKLLGMVYSAQEDYKRAEEPFRKACSLAAKEENACYYLGRIYYSLSRFHEAQTAFQTALRNTTQRTRALHGLALTLEALGNATEAEASYKEAVQSNDKSALVDYGMFLFKQGRSAESINMLRRAGAKAELERVIRSTGSSPPARPKAAPAPVRFEQSTLDMVVKNGASGNKHLVETMIAGAAVFDYDNDGWPDIFVANGASIPSLQKPDSSFYNRLFLNNRDGTFTDVTDQAGLAGEGYCMGVATADYDNDGWVDLFVTGVRSNILYRNRGDGTFQDVTERAGLKVNGVWSVAAGWFDYDNDGLLDLFVVHYVVWNPAAEPYCGGFKPGYRTYCHPQQYQALPNALYHNEGNGRFRNVSALSGIAAHPGKGMGVAFGDYDGDGRLDVFVGNDTLPNYLFHNEGQGKFQEVALAAGVAYNDDGKALSSMGADFRDYDNDGREDIFITALTNETYPLFRNIGWRFADVTHPSRIGTNSLPWSGWSTGMFDFNNDGLKDLFTANGHVMDNAELTSSRKSRQPNSLFLNTADGTFQSEILPGEAFHRGAAFGDFDRDGRMDVVVTRLNEKPLVLRNVAPAAGHWIALKLVGNRSNRDGIGARVHIVTAGGEQWNRVTTSVGYGCSSDRVVHFGLGKESKVMAVEIEWPSGVKQKLDSVEADRYITINEP